ncbi:MAG: ABC transporter substrate-binding protein [Chloroflexota bacterium]
MHRSPKVTRTGHSWSPLAALAATMALVFAACGGESATTAPTSAPTTAPTAEATEAPAAQVYPEAEVTCPSGGDAGEFNGAEYRGTIKSIEAPDAQTVVFNLCAPDVAFLQKVAFSVFAINDSAWLETHAPDGSIVGMMNGTGPLKLDEWRRGDSLIFSRYDGYWGEPSTAATAVLRWSAESAGRLQELQAGTVHGITNVGTNDFETIRNDPNLQLATPPEGEVLNVLYLGMNHLIAPWDNVDVRRAIGIGIDKQRLVDNFYPAGSTVATHFTPCALEYACVGDPWPDYDPAAARQMIIDAGFPDGIDTKIQFRDVIRGYLPQAPVVAQDFQAQLAEIGIRAEIEQQESGEFIGNSNAGALDGLFLLGWGADYPEVTNFLDFHFGPGATSAFGTPYPEIAGPLSRGNSTADPEARRAAYEEANNAIRDLVPMVPIANGAFGLAYLAGVEGAQASSLSNEYMWAMTPPEGDQIVFMQNAEPIGIYCADETDGESLRACLQSMESLYAYVVNGSDVAPSLATGCEPNEDATVWTCTLREGVTFHDGSTLDSGDVLLSYAVQWDAAHPLHVGNTGQFEYFPGLWGGFLNAPPAE